MLAALTERLRSILKGQSYRKIDYLLLGDSYLCKHLHLFCQGPDVFELFWSTGFSVFFSARSSWRLVLKMEDKISPIKLLGHLADPQDEIARIRKRKRGRNMLNRSGNTTDNLCFRYRFRDVFSRFRCCVYNGTGPLLRKHKGNMELHVSATFQKYGNMWFRPVWSAFFKTLRIIFPENKCVSWRDTW